MLAGWAQVVVLIVTARFVWHYLRETERLRKTAQEQVQASQRQVRAAREQTAVAQEQLEGQFRPAIVVRHGSAGRGLELVNLGTGPALHLRLFATERGSGPKSDLNCLVDGNIGFIATDGTWQTNVQTQGAGINTLNGKSLQCQYTSLSGRIYWTVADFDRANNDLRIATRFYNADSPE